MSIIIGFFTVVLLLVCGYITLIVLMQRASSNAGLGASLGGGAAESALGGGANNVLVKGTIIGAVLFFVLSFALYLGHLANYDADAAAAKLPSENSLSAGNAGKPALPSLDDLPEDAATPESTSASVSTTLQVEAPAAPEAADADAAKTEASATASEATEAAADKAPANPVTE